VSRSNGRRVGVVAGLGAVVVATLGLAGAPAGAAVRNPCKVVERAEIEQAFGGTVSTGRKGVSTPASAQCEYQVGADGDRPPGTVTVHLMTTGAKATYKGLRKSADYAPVDGVPNALYAEQVHVVDILKGGVLLGVQGGFVITDPLPIHFYDDEQPLTDLAQIGAARI
jgi:hypothetical protein